MRLGIALLAAGRSSRFGKNKLMADFGSRPLICCALDVIREVEHERAVVVTGCDAVAELARQAGHDAIFNGQPERGIAHSISLATAAMADMDAILFLAGDQPMLSSGSLKRLLDAFASSPKRMACLRDATHAGNPAVFSKTYYEELKRLTGDCGAKRILSAYPRDVLTVDCISADELSDCDTQLELERLKCRLFTEE